LRVRNKAYCLVEVMYRARSLGIAPSGRGFTQTYSRV
jgi:hypothetical protein